MASPAHAETLRALLDVVRGRRVRLEGLPDDLDDAGLRTLSDAGVRVLVLPWPAAVRLGRPGPGPRRVLVAEPATLVDAVAAARTVGADVELTPGACDAADLDPGLRAALDAGVRVTFEGVVARPARPRPGGSPVPVGPALVEALRAGVLPPAIDGGTRAGDGFDALAAAWGGPDQLHRWLAAVGAAPVDRPTPPTPPPVGGRIHVVLPPVADRLAVATWPGLVRALRGRGVDARLVSVWPAARPEHALDEDPDTERRVVERGRAFARELDLTDADAVIVPGWTWGDLVLRHPSLRADARVVVVDDHLGAGLDRWVARWRAPGAGAGRRWTLDPRVTVTSCFPTWAHLYAVPGVPLDRVAWRPYPVDRSVLPPAAPVGAGPIVAAGNHLREHDVLAAAAAGLGPGTPIEVVSHSRPSALAARLVPRPPVPLRAFAAHLAAARVVVVNVAWSPTRAAGISVIALAHALGRPVIATTPCRDHVRHDVNGWLVPAGDPVALREALARVDEDPAWVARLAAGAAEAGAQADVTTWAARLVGAEAPPWPR